ncbi:hypothetical protein [Solemya velum gill symbiont]|uniref:DUF4412 domain-containing protein n=1 Tax=Solemya velum gill symbiont TaxID=2340 RepID=A0A0B0HA20_SOVGS|nr:hypothetical protein [Solemya velum gill symbiont]KHF25905.1 hypothetical protein JV46_20150 [Solemya velum gill symbiont]OOY34221.1 hypothetical protein BOV88_11095 [Solemya velum gill symbiont]OOY36935.1 hypothetical protein BOV89_10115 [Solemya velum gill symbiont]OOY40819.1 hypothetical protein BOV90_02075 [Solemya velum gill symbiont]OOY41678.1 hypothetical protein BOV91_10205 [Solemya velum gill symbiont]
MYKKLISILLLMAAPAGFAETESKQQTPASVEQVQVQMLVYRVDEAGTAPWFSRILVAENMMRLDEPVAGGEPVGSYTLYELDTSTLYNVDLEGPTVLMIKPTPDAETDIGENIHIETRETIESDDKSGLQLVKRHLFANGEQCLEITTTGGEQLQLARTALNQLYATLAKQHAVTLANTPPEFVSSCDIAIHVKETDFRYGKGLMMQSQQKGESEQLVDFSDKELVPVSLFKLPEDAKIITPEQLGPLR